jgi:HAD superfamily hydrolase (TIGR01549 family)
VLVPVFDLDGTLLDSDQALADAFVALGAPPDQISFGHVVAAECARLGLRVDDYLAAYDTTAAKPFDGVDELLAELDRWAVCSNKDPRSARPELARLAWRPDVALFADAFDGPKQLAPVLAALGLPATACAFVGDTGHDRRCAETAGMRFILAAWNPRARAGAQPGDLIAEHPLDVLELL